MQAAGSKVHLCTPYTAAHLVQKGNEEMCEEKRNALAEDQALAVDGLHLSNIVFN